MGICLRRMGEDGDLGVRYPGKVHIHPKDWPKPLTLTLPLPVLSECRQFRLTQSSYFYSSCVIPGLFPHVNAPKDCQDSVQFYQVKDDSALFLLFDGHGSEGETVVNQSSELFNKYFQAHLTAFAHCDATVKAGKQTNSSASGCAVVCLYLTEDTLVAGSVGDSRAILATRFTATVPIPKHQHNPYFRTIPSSPIKSIQLTTDQKPNHKGEKERIESSGGRVARLLDDQGNKSGPYRVMSMYGPAPGLAMSRALGDKMAADVGVVAVPLIHSFPIYKGRDQFLVAASDGVWYVLYRDVMSNEEVACFVETFRKVSSRNSGVATKSSIARLLCEEARYRWMGLVEMEATAVDDICCTVIEFPDSPLCPQDRGREDDRDLTPLASLRSTTVVPDVQ